MFARRRQVQPDVIPSVEGAPHRRNDRESTDFRTAQRRAPHVTPEPDGAQRPRTAKFVKATARRRSEDHAQTKPTPTCCKPLGCSKEPDAFRPKPRTRPAWSLKPQCGKKPG